MSEALKKELIEECKRLDASYNPPLNHSTDEVRSDFKLIKSVHEEKRILSRAPSNVYSVIKCTFGICCICSTRSVRSSTFLMQRVKSMHDLAQRTLQACRWHVLSLALCSQRQCHAKCEFFAMSHACSDTPVACFFLHFLSHLACDEASHP